MRRRRPFRAHSCTVVSANQGGTPITSLHYFNHLVEEVQRLKISDEYWSYVASSSRGWKRSGANSIYRLALIQP